MILTWKILDIEADGELITKAKYFVTLKSADTEISSEGNWIFSDKIVKTPFVEVTEEMVASWIENESIQDGVSVIKSALERQLDYLNAQNSVVPPWQPQVYTPNI